MLRKIIAALFIIPVLTFTVAYSFGVSAGSVGQMLLGDFSQTFFQADQSGNQTAAKKALKSDSQKSDDKKDSNLSAAALTNSTLTAARSGHTATRLDNGKVLIVGGDAGTSEILDAATGNSVSSGSLSAARSSHTATKLSDGRVLITGGTSGTTATASTEIYDPAAGTFSAGAAMNAARSGHTATVLTNGKILIAGGDAGGSAEIYDAATGVFNSFNASMNASRARHSAVLMNDGRVFFAGGNAAGGEELNSAENFNPADSTFTPTGNAMAHHRTRAVLRVLPDGKVQDHRRQRRYVNGSLRSGD